MGQLSDFNRNFGFFTILPSLPPRFETPNEARKSELPGLAASRRTRKVQFAFLSASSQHEFINMQRSPEALRAAKTGTMSCAFCVVALVADQLFAWRHRSKQRGL
jgi:hypothetical protein